MSRSAKFEPDVIETAWKHLGAAKTVREMRAAQAVPLPAVFGLTREQAAAAIGLSTSRVGGIQAEARNPELQAKGTHGGRRRQLMTIEEEERFLRPWVEKAASAGMVIVPPLHEALEQQLGFSCLASNTCVRLPGRRAIGGLAAAVPRARLAG